MTALMWAALDGDEAMVRALLAAGASVSARSNNNETALCYAAMHGEAGAVRILLAAGAQVDERGYFNIMALHSAAARPSLEVARVLLAHGANVNARNSSGQTPLMIAATCNECSDGVIQLLIEGGADLYALDDDANTALDCANKENAVDVARILRNAAARTLHGAQGCQ
jgi:ankyrin repeat protein